MSLSSQALRPHLPELHNCCAHVSGYIAVCRPMPSGEVDLTLILGLCAMQCGVCAALVPLPPGACSRGGAGRALAGRRVRYAGAGKHVVVHCLALSSHADQT